MAWTTPKTWESGEMVTAVGLNEQLSDNMTHLYDRLETNDEYTTNEGTDYTTSSTSFADVDATNLALTITTHGGNVLVGFAGQVANDVTNNSSVYFDIDVDGARKFGDDGVVIHQVGSDDDTHPQACSFVVMIIGLDASSHTFKLQWKSSGATYTMHAGAGTTGYDVHPQFWVQEI